MRTAAESLEIAIQRICQRAGLDVADSVKSITETLEANGYIIAPLMITSGSHRYVESRDCTIDGPLTLEEAERLAPPYIEKSESFQFGRYVWLAGYEEAGPAGNWEKYYKSRQDLD